MTDLGILDKTEVKSLEMPFLSISDTLILLELLSKLYSF
jgi:hypothetical protein